MAPTEAGRLIPRRVRLYARGKYGTARKPEEVPRGFFYNFFYFLWMNPTVVGDPTRKISHDPRGSPQQALEREYWKWNAHRKPSTDLGRSSAADQQTESLRRLTALPAKASTRVVPLQEFSAFAFSFTNLKSRAFFRGSHKEVGTRLKEGFQARQ